MLYSVFPSQGTGKLIDLKVNINCPSLTQDPVSEMWGFSASTCFISLEFNMLFGLLAGQNKQYEDVTLDSLAFSHIRFMLFYELESIIN